MSVLKIALFILISTIVAVSAPYPVPADLVAWYPGDGNSNDISGNNLNPTSTYGIAKFGIGKVGQSMAFVPENPPAFGVLGDGYGIADNDLLDIGASNSFTAEFWANTNTSFGTMLDKRELVNGQYKGYAIYQTLNSTITKANLGLCTIAFDLYQPGVQTQATFIGTPCTNSMEHYAFVFDRSNNQTKIYINGSLIVTGNLQQPISNVANSADLNIGIGSANSVNGKWDGKIDELSIYKRALTLAEVQGIYNAGRQGKDKTSPLPAGSSVLKTVGDLTATFPQVLTSGSFSVVSVEPASQAMLPAGFITSGLAYEITTTATFSGNPTICFNLPSITDAGLFGRLRVMHYENSVWVNQTTTSDFATKTLCGQTSSFSPFAIAEALAPLAAPISIRGRVLTANGRAIARAKVSLTNQEGEIRFASTNQFGYFNFQDVFAGETYVLNANSKRYQFASQVITPTENLEGVDFIAQ